MYIASSFYEEMLMNNVLQYVIENKYLQKLILSKCADRNVLKTTGRLVEIKGTLYLALESFMADGKALQKNIPADTAAAVISEMVPSEYKQLNIMTPNGNCEVKVSRKDKITVIVHIKKDFINYLNLRSMTNT